MEVNKRILRIKERYCRLHEFSEMKNGIHIHHLAKVSPSFIFLSTCFRLNSTETDVEGCVSKVTNTDIRSSEPRNVVTEYNQPFNYLSLTTLAAAAFPSVLTLWMRLNGLSLCTVQQGAQVLTHFKSRGEQL